MERRRISSHSENGERTRAEREAGASPWTPEPQIDPGYEGLELESGTPSPIPEQWIQEWRDAVVMIARMTFVRWSHALSANDLTVTEDTPEWRRLCRMALITAARAHEINARREWVDYSDGFRAARQHRRQWHISAALALCAHTRARATGSYRPSSHCNAFQREL